MRSRFGVLSVVIVTLLLAGTVILATRSNPDDNHRVTHRISLEDAIQYEENFNVAVEYGTLRFPHYGVKFDLSQIKELVEQEGGVDFVSHWGADEDNLFHVLHYILNEKEEVLSIIIQRGACCGSSFKEAQLARS